MRRTAVASPVMVIGPKKRYTAPRLSVLWRQQELCWFLIRRELKVRYAQTYLGAAWMVFQPLGLMLVFTYAFRRIAPVTTAVPYPVFALAGLTLWTFIAGTVLRGANSLISNADLFTRSACPRLLIPLTTVLAGLVDLLIALALFLAIAAAYGVYPTWRFSLVVPFALFALLGVLGLSFLLAAVNVRYRDVRTGLPVLIQLWLFISPIAYAMKTAGGGLWGAVTELNPLVGIVSGFRWSLTGTGAPTARALVLAGAVVGFVLVVGLLRFSSIEHSFADEA